MMYHRSKDKILSKIGYYNDQKGIINRYLREIKSWEPHLENTKRSIIEGIPGKNLNKVIVLGSGWLLDIPYQELASAFKEVWLVDVYHPPQSMKKASHFSNIKFIQTELTGMAEQVYNYTKLFRKTRFKTPVTDFKPVIPIDLSLYDYVVSCNILDQLDIILTDYLKQFKVYSDVEINDIIRIIQQSHFDSLPRNRSLLICDMEEILLDAKNNETAKRSLLQIKLPQEALINKWTWEFDTLMTYYPTNKTFFEVGVLKI
jgi:hypothetical protein